VAAQQLKGHGPDGFQPTTPYAYLRGDGSPSSPTLSPSPFSPLPVSQRPASRPPAPLLVAEATSSGELLPCHREEPPPLVYGQCTLVHLFSLFAFLVFFTGSVDLPLPFCFPFSLSLDLRERVEIVKLVVK
jgi:hypothetical protein